MCEEGLDLNDLGCDSWSNRVDHPVKSTSPTHSYNFSAEEEALYTRRFEEGYDLPDPKYEAWLIVHHHVAAAVSNTITPITGLHASSNMTCVNIDLPVVSTTTSCSTSTIHSSQTDHEETPTQPVTPVHPVIGPNPTQLKLTPQLLIVPQHLH